MNSFELLQNLIATRLDGVSARAADLFEDESVFRQLQALGRASDWYHFEPKTYDGVYLVRDQGHFLVYQQERGAKFDLHPFGDLRSAAQHFFDKYW